MRTLAALLFIAANAALAIQLARTPTVASGRVLAADRLEEVRKDGAVAMDCDDAIPITRYGAVFRCIATLRGGATQVVEYTLKPDASIVWRAEPPARVAPGRADFPAEPRKPASRDPWGNRP